MSLDYDDDKYITKEQMSCTISLLLNETDACFVVSSCAPSTRRNPSYRCSPKTKTRQPGKQIRQGSEVSDRIGK